MSGESAAQLILFITAVLIAASVSAVMVVTIQQISLGIKEQGNYLKSAIATNFKIINDPLNIPTKTIGTNTAYVFYVKNIGADPFPFTNSTVSVLIDGNIIPPVNFTTSPTILYPGEVGEIDVITSLSPGNHRITVILYNGVTDTLEFTT